MDASKRGSLPMQPDVDLCKNQGPSAHVEVIRMKGVPYASAVDSIMYAVRCTRPDVAFSQNLTSRYQQNLTLLIAISSMEDEYIVASEAATEAIWIRKFTIFRSDVKHMTDTCSQNRICSSTCFGVGYY
ncbi:hypothetical protein Tco_0211335 [Tanacetum coccineum]